MVDADRCIELINENGMNYDSSVQMEQYFMEGTTFICRSNDEAFKINMEYQKWSTKQ